MALPNFDATKHHVGLAPTGQTSQGFFISGSYRIDPIRETGPAEYGGTEDITEAGKTSRWTMDDFSGGAFQGRFDDVAMFADSQNFLPSLVENTARTVPPLIYFEAAGHVGRGTASLPFGVFATGGSTVAVCDSDKIRFYDIDDGDLTDATLHDADSLLVDPSSDLYAATHDPADNLVYVIARRHASSEPSDQLDGAINASVDELTMDSTTNFPTNGVVTINNERIYYRGKTSTKLQNLLRGREGTTAASHNDNATVNFQRQYFLAKVSKAAGIVWIGWIPDDAPDSPRGIAVTAGRDILIQMGTSAYLLDVNDARTSLSATRLGRIPGQWRDACTYNGLTYVLITDSEQHSFVYAWDGTQMLPVTDFPYNFLASCIGSYGGRLYVGGRGRDITGTDRYAELYEITGASLRLVKTYWAEARAGLAVPENIYSMVVHEGMLFCGMTDNELLAYDLTRDALWPNIQVKPSTAGRLLQVENLLSTREKLVAWCYDPNRTAATDGFYRMATIDSDLSYAGAGGSGADVDYTSYITTSDFMPEIARDKRWASIRVATRYEPAPTLEYSDDGGTNWGTVGSGTVVQSTVGLKFTEWDLSGISASPAIRFRFTWTRSGANRTIAYAEMTAMTVAFSWLDSGKYSWAFTLMGVENPETTDGLFASYDVAEMRSTLRDYYENKTVLDYKDRDGTTRTVYMSSLSESEPFVGLDIDSGAPVTREAFFSITLTEL